MVLKKKACGPNQHLIHLIISPSTDISLNIFPAKFKYFMRDVVTRIQSKHLGQCLLDFSLRILKVKSIKHIASCLWAQEGIEWAVEKAAH